MSIKSKFCPRCGKSTDKLYASMCRTCYIDSNKPVVQRKASIKFCTVCKSVNLRNVWMSASKPVENYLEQVIASKVKVSPLEKLKKVKIIKLGKDGELKIVSELDGKKTERLVKTDLWIEKYACPECSRQFKTSITAIIQLRTKGDTQKFISDVLKYMGAARRKIVVADERLHGLDLSFSDKRTARVLARRFKERFNCSMKESVKQRGWDRSKHRPLVQSTYILRQN